MKLDSPVFEANGRIPTKFTCVGKDVSPPLRITDAPPSAKSLALIMDDPDAPRGTFTHWTVWGIQPNLPRMAANMARKAELPNGIKQGVNSGGAYGFYPSCPPPGPAHRYIYRLIALDYEPTLAAGASREQFDQAVKGHIMAEASVTGLFGR